MSTPKVEELDDDGRVWDQFVFGHPAGTFFHLSGWKRIFEKVFGYRTRYLVCRQGPDVVGVFPLVHFRNVLAGNTLVSSPFLVHGGPIADTDDAQTALVDHAVNMAEDLGVRYLELRCAAPRSQRVGNWVHKSLYVSFQKDLRPTDDENLKAIPRKQRAMIRKAEKLGVHVDDAYDVERFYPLFAESYRNLGTPVFSKQLFYALQQEFPDAASMTTALVDGSPLSSVISFRFRDTIIPYYGGGSAAARSYCANDFMYWGVMQEALRSGLTRFDFGRSKIDTGAYSFKKHWGFEPQPLDYQYLLLSAKAMPDLSPANPKLRLPIRIWQKLPLLVANVIGPRISRLVG